jgi:flagellar assembly protein FliH
LSALQKLLEDFDARSIEPKTESVQEDTDIEGLKLEAFEGGYKAGWEDALKAQNHDKADVSTTFAQQLQDLSFTYHEAYAQVMNSVTPLLDQMVGLLLPEIARATLGHHLVEQLDAMAKEIGRMKVEIAVSPANVDTVIPLLEQDFKFPIDIVQDEALADEQAEIRFAEVEKQIDLSDLIISVKEAVAGFTHDNRRKVANG